MMKLIKSNVQKFDKNNGIYIYILMLEENEEIKEEREENFKFRYLFT